MKESEVSKLNAKVENLEKEIRNQKFLKLQSKKQEERINRLQVDVNKYKSESKILRKQIKENTKEYEMQLNDMSVMIFLIICNLYDQTIPFNHMIIIPYHMAHMIWAKSMVYRSIFLSSSIVINAKDDCAFCSNEVNDEC